MPTLFPFTAIVRQEPLKRALILNAVNPTIGGVLIRGERGTGKSTAARALAALLPDITVVADCSFGCDPDAPNALCSLCQERVSRGETLPRATRKVSFVELPVSATEDRVVGTLDIERALRHGERRFEPGVLAAAHRGLLYSDEVNLLDDHVVDLLLDTAAMGVNYVEREGISFSHPARFILVGTMNPEEGELRPQLLDRFALLVNIQGVVEPTARALVLARRLQFEADPDGFYRVWEAEERALAERIVEAQRRLPHVRYTDRDLRLIAELTAGLHVAGHRADLAILKTAQAQAAFEGRDAVTLTGLAQAAELALPHRVRRDPLQPDAGLDAEALEQRLAGLAHNVAGVGPALQTGAGLPLTTPSPREGESAASGEPDSAPQADDASPPGLPGPAPPDDPDRRAPTGHVFRPHRLTANLDHLVRRAAGRRSLSRTERKRGRYITSRPGPDAVEDLALDATLRAAAPFQVARRRRDPTPTLPPQGGGASEAPFPAREGGGGVGPSGETTPTTIPRRDPTPTPPPPRGGASEAPFPAREGGGGVSPSGSPFPPRGVGLRLERGDLRKKVRARRVGSLILLAVDASWSMAAAERIAATRSATLALLRDAYQRRDRVGLIVFRRDQASLVLPFTSSVERAQHALADIPIGGKTPLAHALLLGYQAFQLARRAHPRALPLFILLTDGVGNVALTEGATPQVEVARLAHLLRQAGVRSVVIDSEGAQPGPPAARLAEALGGPCLSVTQLDAGAITAVVAGARPV